MHGISSRTFNRYNSAIKVFKIQAIGTPVSKDHSELILRVRSGQLILKKSVAQIFPTQVLFSNTK